MPDLLSLLFPKKCVGCGASGGYLCQSCKLKIYQTELVCPICERSSVGGATHPLCHRKFGLDGLWSLGIYQGPLQKAIGKLKYRFVSDLSQTLVNLTLEYWAKHNPFFIEVVKKDLGQGWTVTSVPLHPLRQNWRGFNQSALLAQAIAKQVGLPYQEVLKRTRLTHQQVGLESKKRKQNIKNAFTIPAHRTLIPANYLLIDDVWTTGSTLKECCYVLKRSGAKKVWAITLAR